MSKEPATLASQLAEFGVCFHQIMLMLEIIENTLSRLENFDRIEEPMKMLRKSCLDLSHRALRLARVCPAGSN